MVLVKLGKRLIGDGQPCFVVLELGATHTGLESAKQLVKAAADAGADAVKFQMIDSNRLMGERHIDVEYKSVKGMTKETMYGALKRRELKPNEWRELKAFCDELKIMFFSSATFPEEVDFLRELQSVAVKVNKGDMNHPYLIDYIAKTGLPVMLDAREKFEELERAVEICEENGNRNIIIMHCPSGYPAKHAGVHLNAIPIIKRVYDYPVGFADHSEGGAMNFAAIALGANLIEKTITLDKRTDAVEHIMSLEPSEMAPFIAQLRAVEQALGTPRIIFSSRVNEDARRSIAAKKDIKKGKAITIDDLDFRRPGAYLPPNTYTEVITKRTKRDIKEGQFIRLDDLES
mgnify:CR=1 FL=1